MTPTNKLVCEVSLQTGWRVEDVLELKTDQIKKAFASANGKLTIIEKKTGKKSTKYINKKLLQALLNQAGRIWVFEGRDDHRKHRSRQAIYRDLKKAARNFRIKINLSPHSLRKNYAVALMHEKGDIFEVQKALNHDNIATAMIYAMSDELTSRHK